LKPQIWTFEIFSGDQLPENLGFLNQLLVGLLLRGHCTNSAMGCAAKLIGFFNRNERQPRRFRSRESRSRWNVQRDCSRHEQR